MTSNDNSIFLPAGARCARREFGAHFGAICLAICLAAGAAQPSSAQSIYTFAEVKQSNDATPFIYTNGGVSGSTFDVHSAPVLFQFDVPNSYPYTTFDPSNPPTIAATLTLSSTTVGSTAYDPPSGFFDQSLDNISMTITDQHGNTLLSVSPGATGDLLGQALTENGSQVSDTLAFDTLNFQSPYVSLGGGSPESYQFVFSAIHPPLLVTGTPGNYYLNTFQASASGAFTVPEPGSCLLFFLGALGLLALRRKFGSKTD